MKFLHTADLHLAAPFGGLAEAPVALQQQVQQATFAALDQIVALAIKQQVDFVLIAGDVFDGPKPSAQALGRFVQAAQKLAAADIPLFFGFGNHDYQQVSELQLGLPQQTHCLPNEVTTFHLTTQQHETVAITGFSYAQRWETQPIIDRYPLHDGSDYQIGVLHGALGAAGDHYAPFSLAALNAKHYDYWALGHIHQRAILQTQPPVIYAGDPQGLSIKETGTRGCWLVQSTADKKLEPSFQPLVGPQWQVAKLTTVPGLTDQAQIDNLCQQVSQQTQSEWQLIQIQVPVTNFSASLLALFNHGQLLAELQQRLQAKKNWPLAIVPTETNQTTLPKNDLVAWEAAADQVFNAENIAATAGKLFDDSQLRASLLAIQPADWQQAANRYLQANNEDEEGTKRVD